MADRFDNDQDLRENAIAQGRSRAYYERIDELAKIPPGANNPMCITDRVTRFDNPLLVTNQKGGHNIPKQEIPEVRKYYKEHFVAMVSRLNLIWTQCHEEWTKMSNEEPFDEIDQIDRVHGSLFCPSNHWLSIRNAEAENILGNCAVCGQDVWNCHPKKVLTCAYCPEPLNQIMACLSCIRGFDRYLTYFPHQCDGIGKMQANEVKSERRKSWEKVYASKRWKDFRQDQIRTHLSERPSGPGDPSSSERPHSPKRRRGS